LIYDPLADALFTAERGGGAFLNDRRLRVAARQNLADCIIATGMPFKGHGDIPLYMRELASIMPEVAGIRRFGAAALDLAWVAAGRFDGFWERGLSPWDVAAGILIIREAGGYVTDLQGGDSMLESGEVVAGNEAVHRQLLAHLRS
jgi:myo-inositol-1(or 4)-monophosphatase